MSGAIALPMPKTPTRPKKGKSGTSELREAENNAVGGKQDGFYTGSGRDDDTAAGMQAAGFITGGRIKQFVAFTLAIGIAGAIMFLLSTTNLLLGPMWSDNVTEYLSNQDISGKTRETFIMRHMLKSQNKKAQKNWSALKKYDTIPDKTLKRFALYDIEATKSGGDLELKYNNTVINDDNFIDMFRTDTKFREAFQKANRSNIRNFFDSPADFFFKRMGNMRNWLKDFKEGPDEEENKKNRDDTLSEHFNGDTTEGDSQGKFRETDEDGNETEEYRSTGEAESESSSTSKADADAKARSYVADLATNVSDVLDAGCAGLRIGSVIAASVTAMDTYNSIRYFLGNIESVSKMMAGEGSTSGINETLNFLTTPASAETPGIATFGMADGETPDTIKTYGAPVEASGFQAQISNAKTTAKTTEPYSIERSSNSLFNALSLDGPKNNACAGIGMASSVASIAATIASFGGTAIIKIATAVVVQTAASAVVDWGLTTTLSFLVPMIAQSLFNNTFDELEGIPAGHMLALGAGATLMMLSRNGSAQMPATKKKVLEFAEVQDTVLAMDAEIDRANRSPFDISSKNTFLGSIINNLLPTTLSTRTSSITALTNSTSKAIANITNTNAFAADGGNNTYITTFGNCKQLEGINAEGDLYCNPISTTDTNTIELEVDDDNYVNTVSTQMTCDDDGNCEIEEDSTLDRFIKYCEFRESPFGILDSNILDDLSITANKVVGFLSNVPVIGDIINAVDAGLDAWHESWATGEKCVVKDDSEWKDEMAYYQRYVEDQRILEQLGAYPEGESPVQQAYNRYVERNPLLRDNSNAGTLARISGIRKEDAETVIAIAEYYNFIQNYDPSSRIAMTGDTTTPKTSNDVAIAAQSTNQQIFNTSKATNQITQVVAILRPTIVYADLRTRSYLV